MEIKPTEISSSKMFGGYNKRYKHYSPTLGCSMNFHIYFPPSPSTSHKFPVLYWLSGLTCTDENFIAKAVAQRVASSEGVALVVPDTSPSKNLEKKMDPNRELDARMDRLMDLVTNFVSAVGDRVPLVDVRHANPNPEPRVDRVTIEQFYKRKPTQFDGGSDPMTAVHWISDMERIFRAIECTEEQKITYSTDTLKEGAQNWWVNLLEQGRPITWDKFVEEFYKRYFPRAAKAQKRREFANLQQGDMTVNEYISKYSELLRFTKDTVITEEDKARKFEEGLRDNIQCRVETHEFGTVAQVHNAALIAERDINKYKQSQQGKRQSEGKGKGQGFFKKPFSRGPGSGSGSQGGSSFSEEGRLLCPTCNRRHRGVCYLLSTCNICKQVGHISKNCPQARSRPPSSTNSIPDMRGKCFDCGQSGHFSKDCPKKRQEASSMASSRARSGPSTDKGKGVEQRQGKSFQLTPGNVSATDSVVSGGLNVEGEADSWDFGVGAGFYLNSTQEKWKNWQMYDYIVKELPKLLSENFPQLDTSRASIFGHSMGGHGALIIYLKNLDKYKSVSAFSPITNPINCAWGQKAFSNYLGDNKAQWEEYDATCLISKFNDVSATILIDQGEEDKFLSDQLLPRNFEEACRKSNVPLLIRFQPGYDHSYFFIATFIDDHIRHHAQALNL